MHFFVVAVEPTFSSGLLFDAQQWRRDLLNFVTPTQPQTSPSPPPMIVMIMVMMVAGWSHWQTSPGWFRAYRIINIIVINLGVPFYFWVLFVLKLCFSPHTLLPVAECSNSNDNNDYDRPDFRLFSRSKSINRNAVEGFSTSGLEFLVELFPAKREHGPTSLKVCDAFFPFL